MGEDSIKDNISWAEAPERLSESHCAHITYKYDWSVNMLRDHYLTQKKNQEIVPRHPLTKELLRRVENNHADKSAADIAVMMYNRASKFEEIHVVDACVDCLTRPG